MQAFSYFYSKLFSVYFIIASCCNMYSSADNGHPCLFPLSNSYLFESTLSILLFDSCTVPLIIFHLSSQLHVFENVHHLFQFILSNAFSQSTKHTQYGLIVFYAPFRYDTHYCYCISCPISSSESSLVFSQIHLCLVFNSICDDSHQYL